ncbi:poly(U)-specific 3'-to-5' RNA exonuclease [Agyrium rufum]|nr:poly(U)-specific 3'-to-5' RNA exonuclease [Agyrium rufum]
MALVEYSDSDDSKPETSPPPTTKRKRSTSAGGDLRPLPSTFHDLYSSTVRVSNHDDPALHGGRQRVIPHVEGNWPSHVYIEWTPSSTESRNLKGLISKINSQLKEPKDRVQSLLESDLGVELPLHISLSRSMMLLTEQRQPFLDELESQLYSQGVHPFDITVTDLRWAPNHEKTRWFLVLGVQSSASNELNKFLQASNTVTQSFDQPPLYAPLATKERNDRPSRGGRGRGRANRRARGHGSDRNQAALSARPPSPIFDASENFHISVGWVLNEPDGELRAVLRGISEEDVGDATIHVDTVKVKIGNHVSAVSLKAQLASSKGIFGS